MVEVPSLLFQLDDLLDRVDFLSVGSNDLMQFLYAADRGNARVQAIEKGEGRGIRRCLHGTGVAQQDASAQHGGYDHFQGRVVHGLLQADKMPAGDMAGFVGDDADQLAGPLGANQKTGIDEQVHPAGHEGVDLVALQQKDMNRGGIEPGHLEDRRGVLAQRLFDLGVADDRGELVAAGLGALNKRPGDQ